jgi:hypothetical protein
VAPFGQVGDKPTAEHILTVAEQLERQAHNPKPKEE